jgi:hypothetical protein
MAYAVTNFKTKRALKEAVAAYNDTVGTAGVPSNAPVRIYSPGPFGCKTDGIESLEGPHYPAPHSWYANVTVVDGIVVKVK